MGIGSDQLGANRVQIYHLNTTAKQLAGPDLRFVEQSRLQTTPSQKQVYKFNVHNNVTYRKSALQFCMVSFSLKQVLYMMLN